MRLLVSKNGDTRKVAHIDKGIITFSEECHDGICWRVTSRYQLTLHEFQRVHDNLDSAYPEALEIEVVDDFDKYFEPLVPDGEILVTLRPGMLLGPDWED